METVVLLLAWFAYVAIVWSPLLRLDPRQRVTVRRWLNNLGKFIRRLYARGRKVAAPQ